MNKYDIIDSVKRYNIFPDKTFEALIDKLEDKYNELIETLTYETLLSANNINYENVIKVLDTILFYYHDKKSIIKHVFMNEFQFDSKAAIEIQKHFNIKDNYKTSLSVFRDDDIDLFTTNFKLLYNIEFDESTKAQLYEIFVYAIHCESIKIYKYLCENYPICEMIKSYNLDADLISSGNIELIKITEQYGYDFSKTSTSFIYDSHQYHIIEYLKNNYKIDDINNLKTTNSLINHFVYGIDIENDVIERYDITCIRVNKVNKTNLILNDCINIISSRKYLFNHNDYDIAVKHHKIKFIKFFNANF